MKMVKLNKDAALIVHMPTVLSCLLISAYALTGCSHNSGVNHQAVQKQVSADKTATLAPSITVSQIGDSSQTLSTPQIDNVNTDNQILSVEQLRNFSDRCQADSSIPPPQGLDCSEINLRMQRLLNADDNIINALLTLGQLGRADNLSRTLDDLNNGRSGQTLTGGAIAGGFVNDPQQQPTPPLEPTPELEQFLQDNGLIINPSINLQRP